MKQVQGFTWNIKESKMNVSKVFMFTRIKNILSGGGKTDMLLNPKDEMVELF